jgi:NitT/TauT family transport system substrate-binding protein
MTKFLLSIVAACALFASGHAKAEPVSIRVAWTVVPFEVIPVLFTVPEDVLKHYGKTYKIELPHFQSSSSMFTSLASGDIDLASMSAFSFSAAIQKAGMKDLRIVADEYEDGIDGYLSGEFVVLKDGPIHKVADLKGKIIASFGLGSSGDMAARVMLRRSGLEDKRDYTVIEANGNNMPAMLFDHKVDLINTTGFTARDPEVVEKTRKLFTRHDAFNGPSQETIFAGREGFLTKNRAAVVDYMEDYLRALNWCLDPKNHDAAIQLVAQFTKAPTSRFDAWMFTKKDVYRDPKGMPKIEFFQRAIDVEHEFGLIKEPLDVKKYAELSLIKEAASRLK